MYSYCSTLKSLLAIAVPVAQRDSLGVWERELPLAGQEAAPVVRYCAQGTWMPGTTCQPAQESSGAPSPSPLVTCRGTTLSWLTLRFEHGIFPKGYHMPSALFTSYTLLQPRKHGLHSQHLPAVGLRSYTL